MLFLAWLAASFLAVVAINLYLRYFGLPRRPLTSAVDGRAYYDRSATVAGGAGYVTSSTGASGGGWTAALFGPGHASTAGETVCIAAMSSSSSFIFTARKNGVGVCICNTITLESVD